MTASPDLADGVAAYGLEAADATASLGRAPLDDGAWVALLATVERDRTSGHLVAALTDGALAATGARVDEALALHQRALVADVLLERVLVDTVGMLDRAGIPVRALKGAAVAHTVYPRPDLRSAGDVDLLVPGDRFDAAVAVLGRTGARRRYPEPRPGFDARFGKGVCLVGPDGFELDLHRTFVAGPLGLLVRTEDLFVAGTTFEIGGRTVTGLDPEAQFLHACYHAAVGHVPPRRRTLRDIAEMAARADLDLARVRALVAAWHASVVVQRSVDATWRAFGLRREPPLVAWARTLEPPPRERRALAAYLGPDRSYARQVAAGLRAVPGWRDRATYARALLLPDRAYLERRDRTYPRRWRRALRLVRSGAVRSRSPADR